MTQQPRPVGSVDSFDYKEEKRHETEVAELREKMQGLKVVSRAKVTQDRIYSAAYHPEPTKDLIFFGGVSYLTLRVSLTHLAVTQTNTVNSAYGMLEHLRMR